MLELPREKGVKWFAEGHVPEAELEPRPSRNQTNEGKNIYQVLTMYKAIGIQ